MLLPDRIKIRKYSLSISIDVPKGNKIGLQFTIKNIHKLVNERDFIGLIEGIRKINYLPVAVSLLALTEGRGLDYPLTENIYESWNK